MVGQTTAKSGACGMAQCSQRGVTSSETNIARSVSTIFASSASCYYPSGIEKRKRKEKKRKILSCIEPTVNHCNGANEKKKKREETS